MNTTTHVRDLCPFAEGRTDQEKDRLANLMAYGVDPSKVPAQPERSPTPPRELDRFDECMSSRLLSLQRTRSIALDLVLLEIEERKQFLEQMTSLGKRKEYKQMISNEIAEVRRLNGTVRELLSLSHLLENP